MFPREKHQPPLASLQLENDYDSSWQSFSCRVKSAWTAFRHFLQRRKICWSRNRRGVSGITRHLQPDSDYVALYFRNFEKCFRTAFYGLLSRELQVKQPLVSYCDVGVRNIFWRNSSCRNRNSLSLFLLVHYICIIYVTKMIRNREF